MRWSLPITLAVSLGCAAPAIADPCPQSSIVVGSPSVPSSSTAPQYSACAPGSESFHPGFPFGQACARYDLVLGYVESNSYTPNGNGSAPGAVRAVDEYRVVGPTAGQPVTVTARLTYTLLGSVQSPEGSGYAWVEFIFASDVRSAEGASGGGVLEHVIATTSGTPFQLTLVARSAGSGASGTATGQLSFANVPAGYHVESCQGFNTGGTPTMPSSWGRLKAIYR